MGMTSGVPLEAAVAALIVAGAAAFVAAAAIAFRLRTDRLMESLDASIGRRALKLREKEASSPAAARLDRLRGELRRVLARHGLAAPRSPAKP
jgi:hypothetical protein